MHVFAIFSAMVIQDCRSIYFKGSSRTSQRHHRSFGEMRNCGDVVTSDDIGSHRPYFFKLQEKHVSNRKPTVMYRYLSVLLLSTICKHLF